MCLTFGEGGGPRERETCLTFGQIFYFRRPLSLTKAEIAKLLDFRSNPGLTSRVSELEIGSNNCPSGAFRSDPLET